MSQRLPTANSMAAASSSASAAKAPKLAKPKAKVVFNPYAKKKSTKTAASASSAPAPTSASIKSRPNTNNATSSNNNPYNKRKRTTHDQITQQKQQPQRNNNIRLPPPPVCESTTFSQAFGDADPDARFGEEERAQQIAFDEELALSTMNNSNNNNNNNSSNIGKASSSQNDDKRDHHKMLQPHMLHISTRQRGNPILTHIKNVPHQFSTMIPDYIFAPTRCALYLSLRYHNLHPNYIHRRIAELRTDFEYRMMLVHVDVEDSSNPILFLNDLCVQNEFTLILAWSEEEAARYLETVKAFDGKDDSLIRKREFTTHIEQAIHALGSVRSVNKTDASQLLAQFGCWKNLANASVEELSVCPGVGPKKVRRLREVFHRPFNTEMAKKRRREEREKEEEKKRGDDDDQVVVLKGGEGEKSDLVKSNDVVGDIDVHAV